MQVSSTEQSEIVVAKLLEFFKKTPADAIVKTEFALIEVEKISQGHLFAAWRGYSDTATKAQNLLKDLHQILASDNNLKDSEALSAILNFVNDLSWKKGDKNNVFFTALLKHLQIEASNVNLLEEKNANGDYIFAAELRVKTNSFIQQRKAQEETFIKYRTFVLQEVTSSNQNQHATETTGGGILNAFQSVKDLFGYVASVFDPELEDPEDNLNNRAANYLSLD